MASNQLRSDHTPTRAARPHSPRAALVPACQGTGRARARDRCWRCSACAPLIRGATEHYLLHAFRDPLSRDALVPTALQRNREVRFITARFPASVTTSTAAHAATRRVLRAFDHRVGIGAAVALVGPSRAPGRWHAHILATIPTIPLAVRSAVTEATGANLVVQLARDADEVRLQPGGPLLRHGDFRSARAASVALAVNVSHVVYVASQAPAAFAAAASGTSPVLTHGLGLSYAALRAAYTEELRHQPPSSPGRTPPTLGHVLPAVMAAHLATLHYTEERRAAFNGAREAARRWEYGRA